MLFIIQILNIIRLNYYHFTYLLLWLPKKKIIKVFLEICKLKTLIFLKEKEIVIRQLEANYKISEFKNLKIIKSNKELPKKYFEVSI